MVKSLSKIADLRPYGIIPLTGEADALSFRILCDLTVTGRDLVMKAFSLLPQGFEPAWNSGVASIMLADGWRDVAVFALLDNGCYKVLLTSNLVYIGLGPQDEYWDDGYLDADNNWVSKEMLIYDGGEPQRWPYGKVVRSFKYPKQGNDRNIHQMSGRVK